MPASAFVPGQTMRPSDDWLEAWIERPVPEDLDRLEHNTTFRFGLDLYRAGFAWEAHEAWELLWQAARKSATHTAQADLLRVLIQVAAAALQMRMHHAVGSARLRAKALERLTDLRRSSKELLDIDLERLAQDLERWNAEDEPSFETRPAIPIRGQRTGGEEGARGKPRTD